ncbi:DUF6247 family protein [Streptomyces oceani]|uniref:Uncharacterized protein n=1 Tax=Streptomyces oceani TaxID=1075402 RepID=A0A1E7KKH0_9ACTN|nr:DUF6247 family protein [Streptomyces oceani]OEV04383.1 hypothetical protein AN216_08885 [Streptomyces oceani]
MIASGSGRPRIPQPPETVSALRQAVAQVAPASLPAFTRELDKAADLARHGSDLSPLRRFTAQWAIFVQINRDPGTARRFRELEDLAESGDATQARHAAAELGRMLDDARASVAGNQS